MSEQDDLEYYIKFPTPYPPAPKDPSSGNTAAEPHEEFVFVYDEDKLPVVILLGWAGCQDKYLAKYSAIYEEKSCVTLRYTAPVECLFWKRYRMRDIGRRLVQVIADMNLHEHPIFFHVFSNGGAFLYQHVSFAMQQLETPLKVKGVIFDSAPGERRISSLFRAISAILGGHPFTNIPMSFVITIFLSILWLFEVIAQSLKEGCPIPTNPIALAEETHSWPQLFLYSNTDDLIPAKDVEKFASRRAARGVRVQMVRFTDSPHVKHYAAYREVYINIVCTFIHECLIPDNSSDLKEASHHREPAERPRLTKRVVLPSEASKPLM
ncbi:transmembrane protein 53 [Neodiprion virginianus]|uniref:transmembrane protein 53 n=1 Tax=Neodiprion fabricii TaxID=2872261 RepID=UPI001ED946C1|nr:transmembrane protein 53 [Neodiprion fabricii]XP_046612700.1 transmembrane protein 53 [Neodiprion virginianus]